MLNQLLWIISILVIFFVLRVQIYPLWKYRKLKNIPQDPPHWFFGHAKELLSLNGNERLKRVTTDMASKYKHIFKLWLGPSYCQVYVCSGRAAKPILEKAHPKGFNYRLGEAWLGQSLLTSAGSVWFRKRKMLTPAFHFDILKSYQDIFEAHLSKLLDKWGVAADEKRDVEICADLRKCALDIIGQCAFGYEIGAQDGLNEGYVNSLYGLSEKFMERGLHPLHRSLPDSIYKLTGPGKVWYKYLTEVKALPSRLIGERRARYAAGETIELKTKSGRTYQDFLGILLSSQDAEGQPLSTKEVMDEVNTFLFGGHDTTSHSLMWIIYCLAVHQHVQKKAIEEVDRVLVDDRVAPTYEELNGKSFRYLENVVKESHRLYPPVPAIGRLLDEDVVIEGHHIPAGNMIGVSIYAIHRNPFDWDRPDEFDPDRFSVQNSNNFAFVPFSAGPRNCIGQRFAFNEEITTLTMLLKRFTFELVPGQTIKPEASIVLRPEGENGIRVVFKRRN